jgi:hypothetical protein
VGSADTPGNANDVRVVGNLAYVADGSFGLRIFNVSNPASPAFVGALDTVGEAMDVMVFGNRAYVADGDAGLAIVNITNPAAPSLLKQVDTPGTARGVDVLPGANNSIYAIVADDSPAAGLRVIDATNGANASIVANLALQGSPKDLRVSGNVAHVASYTGGHQTVNLVNPLAPVAGGSLPTQFVPRDVEISGNFALFAEQLFPNAVPVVDITSPLNPLLRTTIDFSSLGDYAGTGIAINGPFVYITMESFVVGPENGVTGNTRLFIGQFLPQSDLAGQAPTVSIISPTNNSSVIQGSTLNIRADAQDDVAVASVTFSVNGTDVFTDTSAPYEAAYVVPGNATNLALRGRAIDLGGNTGMSAVVNVTAIPDPKTTVTGRVLRRGTLAPVVGATVMCLNLSTNSVANGNFSLANVPTVQGDITCSATFVENGKTLRGFSSPKPPVPAGVTNAGDITISEGSVVLLLSDATSSGLNSLVTALTGAGNTVTVRPPPEYTWDNTEQYALSNFGCVIHLNGATPYNVFSQASQTALVNFVRTGGGFISSGWLGYEAFFANTAIAMRDIALQGAGSGLGAGPSTYTKVVDHPVLDGVPNQFTLQTQGDEGGAIAQYAVSPVLKIMDSTAPGESGIYVREFEQGRAVKFSFMAHWSSQSGDVLADANAQKLFINAIRWACVR